MSEGVLAVWLAALLLMIFVGFFAAGSRINDLRERVALLEAVIADAPCLGEPAALRLRGPAFTVAR